MDIREFYDAGGEEKPGKKGIALSPEQVLLVVRSGAHIALIACMIVGRSESQRGHHRCTVRLCEEEKVGYEGHSTLGNLALPRIV